MDEVAVGMLAQGLAEIVTPHLPMKCESDQMCRGDAEAEGGEEHHVDRE